MKPILQISNEDFPIVYKDLETNVLVSEIFFPLRKNIESYKIQALLDNNTIKRISADDSGFLKRISWLSGIGSTLSINPSLAFLEQFLSNPYKAKSNIEEFENRVKPLGMYNEGSSKILYELFKDKEIYFRRTLGLFFCYVSLIFHWESTFLNDPKSIDKWIQLFSDDIPKLQLFYLLGGLFAISKFQKDLSLKSNNKKIYPICQSFCAERKEEKNDLSRRLRNRAFDLLYFYEAPKLTLPSHQGYESRLLLVTEDQFLGEFIAYLFFWNKVNNNEDVWQLALNPARLNIEKNGDCAQYIEKLMDPHVQGRPSTNDEDIKKKVRNLIELTLKTLNPAMGEALKSSLMDFNVFELI